MKVNRLPFTKMIWFFYQLSHPTKSHFLTKILHLPFLLVSKKNSSFFKPKGIFPPTSTPLPRCEVLHFSGTWNSYWSCNSYNNSIAPKTPSSLLIRDEIFAPPQSVIKWCLLAFVFRKRMVLSEFDLMVLRSICLWVRLSKQISRQPKSIVSLMDIQRKKHPFWRAHFRAYHGNPQPSFLGIITYNPSF